MAGFSEELFEASLCIESDEWTKDTLSGLPAGKGVLFFTNAENQPVQLLQTANLRRTAQAKLAHDESPSPNRKVDISELTVKIFYTRCYNNFELQLTYLRLAHAIFQKAARDWIQLPTISLATIDTDADLPFFFVSVNPKQRENQHAFGLFPTRKAAGEFVRILNTVFCLCRNPSLLNTGREASCPYFQMQTCPGPCIRETERPAYRGRVEDALAAANGHIDTALENRKAQMQDAAASMQFEQAKSLKEQIHALQKLKHPDYRWTKNLSTLCILHIDKSSKIESNGKKRKQQQYIAYKISCDHVVKVGRFIPDTADHLNGFFENHWHNTTPIQSTVDVGEHLGALSLLLFKNNPQGLWIDCSEGLMDIDTLFDELARNFSIKSPN